MEKGINNASREFGLWAEDLALGIGAVVAAIISVLASTVMMPIRVLEGFATPDDNNS